jgi:SSS family solute:Na+ symporter
MELGFLDGSILAAYLITLAGIGWWAARRTKKTTEDYFLAGRSIPWLVTLASFAATCVSALTFIGQPAEGYSSDYRYLLSNPGDLAACFFVAGVFLPRFQKLGLTSIYEAVSARFGPSVRTACSGYFIVTRTLASTVRIVAIAKVLEVVSGGSLSYGGCVAVVILVILSYATLGGGRAVAWTDLLQFILLMSGAAAALVCIVHAVPGGAAAIIEAGRAAHKFNFLELYKPSNLGLLTLMIVWAFFNSTATYGADQDMAQRLLACNDPRKARWSLLGWGLLGIPITFLFLSIGVALFAYAKAFPAFTAGMTDPDHVFPRFILTAMPHGLRGLLLAAVASAAMGSADSALASLSTAFTLDFYKPIFGRRKSEAQLVKVSKASFFGFGVLFLLLALGMRNLDRLLWLAFRLISFTYGPMLGLFLVALLTDWKLAPRKVLTLLFSTTAALLALGAAAWRLAPGGGFWAGLHETWWRLYIVAGALVVPLACAVMRDQSHADTALTRAGAPAT